ncbi:MAG: 5'/3'-nucleotidase SurE [Methanobrevibacter sp.]|nr:5'/3'-nucleotidase SurE [Methanobrevibacter sp.]
MKALISNDDGITASGIFAVKQAIEDLCDVTVVAPEIQQSGIGHALTLFEPLRINQRILEDGSIGYAVTGTPTDAVTLGLFEIMDEKPDIMISGINTGFNIGKSELTTSGTIGAAIEAASFGIPTIAISQSVTRDDIKFENGQINLDYSHAQKMLRKLVKHIFKKGMPEDCDLLNLNIPSNPSSDEFEVVRLANRMYMPSIETRYDPRKKPYYWISGELCDFPEKGTDGNSLIYDQKTTLTPIKIDQTGDKDSLKKWLGD